MGKRTKTRRERNQADQLARKEEIAQRKRDRRAKSRARNSLPSLPRKEELRILLDLVWRATGGPIVWIAQWSPFSKSRRD
jgi:hypothetical protein